MANVSYRLQVQLMYYLNLSFTIHGTVHNCLAVPTFKKCCHIVWSSTCCKITRAWSEVNICHIILCIMRKRLESISWKRAVCELIVPYMNICRSSCWGACRCKSQPIAAFCSLFSFHIYDYICNIRSSRCFSWNQIANLDDKSFP